MADISIFEQTTHDGDPREFYFFSISGATDRHYTSASEDVATHLVRPYTYVATAGLSRSEIIAESDVDPPPLEVTLPFDSALITDILFKIPPRAVKLFLYRSHAVSPNKSNTQTIWVGHVEDVKVSGREATLIIPALPSRELAGELPSYSFQAQCNHILGDARCGIDMTLFDHPTTVASISDDELNITLASLAPGGDGVFRGGLITRVSDGESRIVTAQTGLVCTILRPFRELAESDDVTAFQGCDHTRETCIAKFNNLVNFGGFPDINGANPFDEGLKLTGQ